MVRFADFATVGLIVGGGFAGLGTYLLLSAKPPDTHAASGSSAWIEPWLGLGFAGVRGRL